MELIGYRMVTPVPPADRLAAIQVAQAYCEPLPPDDIKKNLGALRYLTRAKEISEAEADFTLALYTTQLGAFPADVTLYVLTTQHSVKNFWPDWKDLEDRLEPLARQRFAILDALQADARG